MASIRGFHGIVILYTAFLVILIQPGVCPCWLLKDPDLAHHPAAAGAPLEHHCDFQSVDSSAAPAVVQAPTPASVLIAMIASAGVWRSAAQPFSTTIGWTFLPISPPPR